MISFALPWALVGLVAAGIPLFLHLVQRHEPREMIFPAVRYLEDATRDHHRRLQLRNLLLLILRTLLIIALVLAAAGTTLNRGGVGSHAPSALALIVDNSASSATIIDGEATLDGMVRAATAVLNRATLADRLWLITADGTLFTGTPTELRARLAALRSEPVRLDLGAEITRARSLVRSAGRPGEVVVVSDMQQSAVGQAAPGAEVLVLRPRGTPPVNRAIAELQAASQPWGPEGGHVTIRVSASDTAPVPVTLALGNRRLRDVLVTPGIPSVQRIGPLPAGWNQLTASLPPDEFRLDDARTIGLRVAPAASVRWDSTDRFVNAAMGVLAADHRVRAGDGVRLGTLGPGASVVFAPADPSQIGALNRALAARGSAWQFGSLVVAEARTDSGAYLPEREAVSRRVSLQQSGAGGEVLATVDGAPWLVRSGDIVLLGSRFDPGWTSMPFSASFVPFLDALLTRAIRGEPPTPLVVVGESVRVPDRVTAAVLNGQRASLEPGLSWRIANPGAWLLLSTSDTVGALDATVDARESELGRATDDAIQSLWASVTVADLERGPRRAFTLTGRRDLRGALLALALCCALVETGLLGLARSRSA